MSIKYLPKEELRDVVGGHQVKIHKPKKHKKHTKSPA